MDKRASGDLRSVSLSQRELAAKAREHEAAQGSNSSGAASGAAAAAGGGAALGLLLGAAELLPSSSSSPATASASKAATTTTPIANEGRIRARDMTDVYVCFFFFPLSFSIDHPPPR
jgi:hypothetical protein